MSKGTLLFKSKQRMSRKEAADFLRHLADKIDQGNLTLKQGEQSLELNMPAEMALDVQVKDKDKGHKGLQHELEVEIKWYEGGSPTEPLELE